MALDIESRLAKVWREAVVASLSAGTVEALDAADKVMLAYEARFFSPTADEDTGATVVLRTMLPFRERSWLIGQMVTLIKQIDVPSIGKIKDFSNGDAMYSENVLVVWESGAPEGTTETWVNLDKLQLIWNFG